MTVVNLKTIDLKVRNFSNLCSVTGVPLGRKETKRPRWRHEHTPTPPGTTNNSRNSNTVTSVDQ